VRTVKLSDRDISQFCRELAVLLHAGIPLTEGAYLLAQEDDAAFRDIPEQLSVGLEKGKTLSEAMEETEVFPRGVWGMVRIAEQTGRLEETLNALAEDYGERCRIRHQIRTALAYPGLILLLMTMVILVLLIFVLPVFDQVYASLGSPMTGIAGALLELGRLLKGALPGLFAVLLLLCGVLAAFLARCDWRQRAAVWYGKHFGDKGISRRFHNARFARALAMGLGSGIPVEEALLLAEQLLSDIPGAADRCGRCVAVLHSGGSLAEALGETDFLSPAQSRMLSVGLRGGNADRVMQDLADRLMEDARNALENRVTAIEPALVLVTSILVGLILLAVMLPLMELLSGIG